MKKCINCQTEIADSANFCHICGSPDFEPIAAEPAQADPVAPNESISENVAPAETVSEEIIPGEAPYADPVTPEPSQGNWYTDTGTDVSPVKEKKKPSKGMIIGISAGVVALIAVIVVVSVLTNPVRRFMNSIKEGDAATAAEIYYDSIIGNESRAETVYDKISDYVNEQLTLYLDGEITYDELSAKLWTIDAASVYNQDVYEALDQAYSVNEWRDTYQNAEEAFADGNYALAISLYSRVAGADFEHGEDAVTKLAESTQLYRNQILDAVDAYQDDHAYDSAIALLNEALQLLPNDAALESAREACLQAEYDYAIDCIIAEAQVYYPTNDYIGAITYLDEHITTYPDEVQLLDERNNCLALFEEYVINESFRLATEGEYVHAASLAASGLEYFSSTKVSELYTIYLSYIPVILGQMEIFVNDTKGGSWASYTNETDSYLQDNYSNTYSHSLTVGCGSLTYLVNFKYQTLSGTVAFPKGLSADNARESATLTICGDGQEIAVFRDVTADSKPETFSLDISSYEKITLTWECEGYNIWADWGDFATIFDGLVIPIPLQLPASVG